MKKINQALILFFGITSLTNPAGGMLRNGVQKLQKLICKQVFPVNSQRYYSKAPSVEQILEELNWKEEFGKIKANQVRLLYELEKLKNDQKNFANGDTVKRLIDTSLFQHKKLRDLENRIVDLENDADKDKDDASDD